MKYIGVDQSITNTGIVILGQNGELEKSIAVSFAKYKDGERFKKIYEYFFNFSKEYGNDVYFALEDYAFNSKFSREKLGELRALIEIALIHSGAKIAIIPIKLHRKMSLGNGNLSKESAILVTEKIYGVKFKTPDEYDAYSIAKALHHFCTLNPLLRNKLEKIRKNW